MMGTKLGLTANSQEDETLVTDLLDWMHKNEADYTNTFRDLSQEELPGGELYTTEIFQVWHTRWQARLGEEDLNPPCPQEIGQPDNHPPQPQGRGSPPSW